MSRDARRGPPWLALVGLTAIWALLYLPHLGTPELDDEEGRRFLPARTMLATGDQVLPAIFERPYLAKPPLHYWLIEVCSLPGGAVTTWSTRLPSALATLGVALALFVLARRHLEPDLASGERRGPDGLGAPAGPGPSPGDIRAPGAAACSALAWLVTPLAIEKGTLGELEAPLALCVTLALAALFAARAGGRGALAWGGLALGAAVLLKGPAAWVFLGAAAAGAVALEPARTRSALGAALTLLAISAAVGGAWLALLLQRLGWDELQATWSSQLVGARHGLGDYLGERWTYAQRAFAGLLPGSLLAFAFVRRAAGRRGPLPPLVRFALATAAGAALFFLVYPRSRARYLYPAAPWLALVAGYVLARGIAAPRTERLARVARATAIVGGAAGALAGVACLADRLGLDVAPPDLDPLGVALAAGMVAAGAAAVALARRARTAPALAAAFCALAGARLVHATQVVPHDARQPGNTELAVQIEAALPAGTPVFTARWGEFNLLAHLPRRVIYTDDPARAVGPGEPLLYAIRPGEKPPAGVAGWVSLGTWPLEKGRTMHAVRGPG
jgi:4-amino-4-deoxy-L-arabinose transferase-like glycosyltransferase